MKKPIERARKAGILARFREDSGRAFLSAYRAAAAGIAHRWADKAAESALLDLFVMHKAAYEVAYEASNRPAWLWVPLRGLEMFADKPVGPDPR